MLHVRHTVVKSLAEGELKRTDLATEREERIKHKIGRSVRRHVPEEPDRAITPAIWRQNPERAREEPRGTPHATGPGLHREWPIWDVDVGNALSATHQYTREDAREERARRLRKTLLKTRIQAASVCVCAKLVVN